MEQLDPTAMYTAEEAAKALGVKPETVKVYLRRKSLRGLQVGPKRQWKIHGSEIIRKQKEWNLA
jgi:excisionase family DNA binding protein